MSPSTRDSVASSGITVNSSTGERYIPSSVRADGSKRREIRVRPGYRPPEDVELYRNRAAEAWKNRGKAGVPGTEGLVKPPTNTTTTEQTEQTKSGSAASNKNAKRREAKKKSKAVDGTDGTEGRDVSAIENWRTSAEGSDEKGRQNENATAEESVDADAENEKKARNLRKKLRQAKDLREKKSQGESLLPEQLEKIIKIQELVRQLDALGFDSNGEKKDGTDGKDV